jgi:hypothetical protein
MARAGVPSVWRYTIIADRSKAAPPNAPKNKTAGTLAGRDFNSPA